MNIADNMIASSPLAMATTDGPGHKLRFANAAFCGLLGVAPDDIVGRPISEAISTADERDVLELLDDVYSSHRGLLVSRPPRSGSSRIVANRSYTAWSFSEGEDDAGGLVIQVTDYAPPASLVRPVITDAGMDKLNREIIQINEQLVLSAVHQQVLAEMAAASELRLRSLIHGLNAIVCEMDAQTRAFTFLSERAETVLGYSLEQWNEEDFWKRIIHPDDYDGALAALTLEGPSGRDLQYAFRVMAADGSEMWLRNIISVVRNVDGQIVRCRCVIVDATEQQSAHVALARELERNRAIAEAMQYSILWQQPEKRFPGLRVAAFYEPALAEALVGGDFFDAFKLGNGSIMLVVGDVTGKGLKAAARTLEVTFALRAFAQDYKDPATSLAQVNRFICDFHHDSADEIGNALIVLALVVVDTVTGATRVASGGAERPLILRASGAVDELVADGLILGIDTDATYETVDVSLEYNDILIMTTDGITEARHGRDFFGYDRLLDTARKAMTTGSPQDVGRAVVDAAHAFTGGRLNDDICLLVASRSSTC